MNDILIRNIDVTAIHEAVDNPNAMSPADFALLCRAVQVNGMLQPILLRQLAPASFRVIDGHHRLRACKNADMPTVPAVIIECSDTEETILRLEMGKLHGEFDLTAVGRIIKELQDAGVDAADLELTGYSEQEIADLVGAVSQNVDLDVKMSVPVTDYEVEEGAAEKPLVLEIAFSSLVDLKTAKKGLKRAAGKGKDLATGLLRLLGEEQI